MPKVRVLDRKVLYIYDRWDAKATNGRKTLTPDSAVYISEQTMAKLEQLGIHFEIVDGEKAVEVELVPEEVRAPEEEVKVETPEAEEAKEEVKPSFFSKKKKKRKKKVTK